MAEAQGKEPKNAGSVQMDQREYIRVPVRCPAIYRVVPAEGSLTPPQEQPTLYHVPPFPFTDPSESTHRPDEQAPAGLVEMFLWLDWKLNYLIKTLSQKQEKTFYPNQALITDLSGSGIRFTSAASHPPGSRLEFEIVFPMIPFREIVVLGDVIWSREIPGDASEPSFEMGVTFKEIKETDREHIIRYVVRTQMQLQRERRPSA